MVTQAPRPLAVDAELQHDLEQFYFWEADLLDDRKFTEWIELLTDDVEYWMPIRSTRALGDEENEFSKLGEGAFFDDTKPLMEERIRKLYTGFAWSEDPPSRTRHFVANVRVLERLSETELKVACNFLLYRTRLAKDVDTWVGRRDDILRRVDEDWKIAQRHIFLDQVVLDSKNLSVFF